MTKSVLSDKHFHDETAAYRFVEKRVWPDGPVCPHCGGVERISKMKGASTRIGTYKCYQCRKPFTVKVGTVFEASHVKLHLWLQAIFLMASSKKGVSSNQLHRTLGVTVKTAWFMSHRIREAMRSGVLEPMGGAGKIVEADETYFGMQADPQPSPRRKGRPFTTTGKGYGKRAILALVERGGQVRSFHVAHASTLNVTALVRENIHRETRLHTDESKLYHLSNDSLRARSRMASPKPKPKPKPKKGASEKPQSERFKETARAHGADESGSLFERAMGVIVPPKRGNQ